MMLRGENLTTAVETAVHAFPAVLSTEARVVWLCWEKL